MNAVHDLAKQKINGSIMPCQMHVHASFVMAGGITCIQSYSCHCVIVLCIRIIIVTIGVYLHIVYKLADVSACMCLILLSSQPMLCSSALYVM